MPAGSAFDSFHANVIASVGMTVLVGTSACPRQRVEQEHGLYWGGGRGGCTTKNSKTHGSGVTSLRYHPSNGTSSPGSYDGSTRWDCRIRATHRQLDTGGVAQNGTLTRRKEKEKAPEHRVCMLGLCSQVDKEGSPLRSIT